MSEDQIKVLEEKILQTQELINDNIDKQQALIIEAEALSILEEGCRQEVQVLKMYIDILKPNPTNDEEVAELYKWHIAELGHQLDKISQIGEQMKGIHLEINNLKRSKSRSDSIILGYRQQIQDIEYSKSSKGNDYFTQRVAMSISETYLNNKSKESVAKRLTSFAKDIFKK